MLSQTEMNIKAVCMKMERDLHQRRRAENIANIRKKKEKKEQELYHVFARYCARKGTDCSKGVEQYWGVCSPSERLIAIKYQREFERKQEEEHYKVFVRYIIRMYNRHSPENIAAEWSFCSASNRLELINEQLKYERDLEKKKNLIAATEHAILVARMDDLSCCVKNYTQESFDLIILDLMNHGYKYESLGTPEGYMRGSQGHSIIKVEISW